MTQFSDGSKQAALLAEIGMNQKGHLYAAKPKKALHDLQRLCQAVAEFPHTAVEGVTITEGGDARSALLDAAKAEAATVLEAAKAEAVEVIAMATEEAVTRVAEAKVVAGEVLSGARAEADEILAEATSLAGEEIKEAGVGQQTPAGGDGEGGADDASDASPSTAGTDG